jgi:MSHA biogenesis protein MshE
VKLGQLLVKEGVLTAPQVEEALAEQRRTGAPFGVLCEELFDVEPDRIEEAWVRQYELISQPVDPTREIYDDAVRDVVTRRQAWQFRVLPIRYHGDELMVATSTGHLRRALRFVTRNMSVPVYVVLAAPGPLLEVITKRYPMAGLTPEAVAEERLVDLVGRVLSSSQE